MSATVAGDYDGRVYTRSYYVHPAAPQRSSPEVSESIASSQFRGYHETKKKSSTPTSSQFQSSESANIHAIKPTESNSPEVAKSQAQPVSIVSPRALIDAATSTLPPTSAAIPSVALQQDEAVDIETDKAVDVQTLEDALKAVRPVINGTTQYVFLHLEESIFTELQAKCDELNPESDIRCLKYYYNAKTKILIVEYPTDIHQALVEEIVTICQEGPTTAAPVSIRKYIKKVLEARTGSGTAVEKSKRGDKKFEPDLSIRRDDAINTVWFEVAYRQPLKAAEQKAARVLVTGSATSVVIIKEAANRQHTMRTVDWEHWTLLDYAPLDDKAGVAALDTKISHLKQEDSDLPILLEDVPDEKGIMHRVCIERIYVQQILGEKVDYKDITISWFHALGITAAKAGNDLEELLSSVWKSFPVKRLQKAIDKGQFYTLLQEDKEEFEKAETRTNKRQRALESDMLRDIRRRKARKLE
ncbi:hypothetical protein SISSUDRAFT_1067905 [Sistotremastrum suecicum HHB10207 ss-3]|uniref:Uncharacterized protein n=1 Tax=Sistotremastrum suecicum HHB10207 ss-3 TaxID=1314776 RepID=A0A165WKL9_9AGAM|nr:hypothetical protein SISSUDRAFT_1067905 [Sistotremastrum suecicum HHB10207 ss-3]